MPKGSHKVLPLRERVKVLDFIIDMCPQRKNTVLSLAWPFPVALDQILLLDSQ